MPSLCDAAQPQSMSAPSVIDGETALLENLSAPARQAVQTPGRSGSIRPAAGVGLGNRKHA